MADYGRAAFDVRHRAFIGGSMEIPYGFRLSPFIIINSGTPFNITTGTDLNGDSIFNDRPVLVNTATCPTLPVGPPTGSVYCTPLGTFSAALPTTGQKVLPINYETGPANTTFNLRLSKTFGFGKEKKGSGGGGSGDRGGYRGGGLGGRGLSGGGGNPFSGGATTNRPYNLTFSVSGRNIFNSVTPASPVGNLSSPSFGQSIALGGFFASASANRRVDLQAMFSF
jgi:hypothetical protein